jgi:hypothetical protein
VCSASLPLAVVAIGLVLAWMPADGARSAPRLQAYALSTAMLALGALLLALTWLGEPGHRAAGAVLLIAMLLAAVHLRHARQQAQPLLRWSLLSHRACAWRCWVSGSARCVHRQSAGQYPAAAPGRLQRRTHRRVDAALGAGLGIAITASKRLLARFGPATVLRVGMLQASGLLLMALLPSRPSRWPGCCSR